METGLGRISSVTENGIDPYWRCRGAWLQSGERLFPFVPGR